VTTVNRIGLFRGEGFQKFCSVLLAAEYPNFQAVDGAGGDRGNDGFTIVGDAVFQAYAPDVRSSVKVRNKIEESVAQARELRKSTFPALTRFVFLTPFDLTHDQHRHLRAAAEQQGLVAESWGETHLLALLAEHPAIKSEFPEILLPDVIDEIRKLRAVRVAAAPYDRPQPLIPGADLDLTFDVHPRERDDAAPGGVGLASAWARVLVVSEALALESIEPEDEDAFRDAIRDRFFGDENADFATRNASRVVVRHTTDQVTFDRLWSRWASGAVGMFFTLGDLHRPGSYSAADMTVDITRALRLAALLGGEGPAAAILEYTPSDLRVEFDPSDPRARQRLGARLQGIERVEHPVATWARKRAGHCTTDLRALASDAHHVAASLVAPLLRDFHSVRASTKRFADSIPALMDAELAASRL